MKVVIEYSRTNRRGEVWKKRWGCRKIESKNVFFLENIFLGNFVV
jgi:hypothetical protein